VRATSAKECSSNIEDSCLDIRVDISDLPEHAINHETIEQVLNALSNVAFSSPQRLSNVSPEQILVLNCEGDSVVVIEFDLILVELQLTSFQVLFFLELLVLIHKVGDLIFIYLLFGVVNSEHLHEEIGWVGVKRHLEANGREVLGTLFGIALENYVPISHQN